MSARAATASGLLALAACGGGGGSPTASQPAGPQLAVSGTLTYEDRVYDVRGFTEEQPRRPIRFTTVQLVADDNGAVLGEVVSRADGTYSLTASVAPGRQVHVAVVARTGSVYPVEVVNAALQAYALAAPSFAAGSQGTTQDFFASRTNLGGVFNIVDEMLRGSDLVRSLSRESFPRLRVVWTEVNRERTSFSPDRSTIALRGHPADPDEYDDDVILHEFGHYVAHFFSIDTSPGGFHDPFDDEPEPPALAWSEGYATWFGSETHQSPAYVDTFGTGTFAFEIETPTAQRLTRGDTNEIAVAAILWDVGDPANEPHDGLDRRRDRLWDVTETHIRQARPPEVTIHTFCQGWFARGHGEAAALQAVFAHREIACP